MTATTALARPKPSSREERAAAVRLLDAHYVIVFGLDAPLLVFHRGWARSRRSVTTISLRVGCGRVQWERIGGMARRQRPPWGWRIERR